MLKNLIIDAFEKAREDARQKGKTKPSDNYVAKKISEYLDEETGFRITERSLFEYYKAAKNTNDNSYDINIPQQKVVHGLCEFLGYENFQDYIKRNSRILKTEDLKNNLEVRPLETTNISKTLGIKTSNVSGVTKSIIVSVIFLSIVGAASYIYVKSDRKCWMTWKGDHYEEVEFDSLKLKNGSLKLCDDDRIENFKQIKADCNTEYFSDDGSTKIWYGKDREGNVNCFTSLGKHPETGKTLKEITPYMINKYFCPD